MSTSNLWEIKGVDRDSGAPRKNVVRAETEELALAQVDFLVSDIARRVARKPRLRNTKPKKPAPVTGAPPYQALQLYSMILKVVGVLAVVFAAGMAILTLMGSGGNILAALTLALPTALAGLVIAASGEALEAFRDIARNSFNRNS